MNIKDYLHLYLGCECLITKPSLTTANDLQLGFNGEPFILTGKLLHYFIEPTTRAELKPILRPLRDMTEEEVRETVKFFEPDIEIKDEDVVRSVQQMKKKGIDAVKFDEDLPAGKVFEYFRYLLSKHFDLFGLIEAGLAIEKPQLIENQVTNQ